MTRILRDTSVHSESSNVVWKRLRKNMAQDLKYVILAEGWRGGNVKESRKSAYACGLVGK